MEGQCYAFRFHDFFEKEREGYMLKANCDVRRNVQCLVICKKVCYMYDTHNSIGDRRGAAKCLPACRPSVSRTG
jgi:hypothetical protein